ncbi:MAG TPA: hypothetical protein VND91_09315 [Candidatus Saccharimonadia bacterium]|nr:hypothetical protein [Candidatus Saccharimonadia bacterium]
MSGTVARCVFAIMLLVSAALATRSSEAYVGRCASCGTASDVDAFHYARDPAVTKPGAILTAESAAKPGRERGTRIEIRMDKGGRRVIQVHGDPRIYKGDRVRLYRDRIELL